MSGRQTHLPAVVLPSSPLWLISQLSISGRSHWFIRVLLTWAIKEGERGHESVARSKPRCVCERGWARCQLRRPKSLKARRWHLFLDLLVIEGCRWMSGSAVSALSAGHKWKAGAKCHCRNVTINRHITAKNTRWNITVTPNKCLSAAAERWNVVKTGEKCDCWINRYG